MTEDIKSRIREQALALGFDAVGFAPAQLSDQVRQWLAEYLAEGRHGDMGWMVDKADRRGDPQVLWPDARSIVVLGMNYGPGRDPLAILDHPERAGISVYAQGRDYHDHVKNRLKALARWMADEIDSGVKVFVDTAPVMEKPLGQQAGLGWQGKHTNLVSRGYGSWLFLGEVYSTLDLAPDATEIDHCGSCTRCLTVCPTDAFPAPYQLDARRCISYLTIEHKGVIAREFRVPMGNRIYGCDDCLAVCPWNKYATPTGHEAFLPRAELMAPRLADLAQLDDAGFRQLFSGSPIKRIGRDRFVRNVLIAIGNSESQTLVPITETLLTDESSLVRGMAVWALSRLLDAGLFAALRETHLPTETDEDVRAEWEAP
ncbi:tRNA epoxyqueuosine(34) reductase QueG [Oceanibaculum nanhaiense]|jgi:epoxyqueuosine reductase|uniref:tRNA epoxyqueuosine(34) reductase QueG n=1 Tax=Oceanibaculum nanhaiense TaxID=1909734 RepID=UPI000A39FD66|nr:tRNA epoxyqueuosine(34) reductase QueG [Oceanibaculum nanhaiense]MBC7135864.1 tRNA epoxyqueuosine(34) reductase QueG [Oceanibaculum nanhaiense]